MDYIILYSHVGGEQKQGFSHVLLDTNEVTQHNFFLNSVASHSEQGQQYCIIFFFDADFYISLYRPMHESVDEFDLKHDELELVLGEDGYIGDGVL